MTYLDAEDVVARSLSFSDRVALIRSGRGSIEPTGEAGRAVAAHRLRSLHKRLEQDGRSGMLSIRLRRDDIPISLAAAACSPGFRAKEVVPEWFSWFELGVRHLADGHVFTREAGIPFDVLLGAFEQSALQCIDSDDRDGHWREMTASAQDSACVWLRKRLAGILQWCLFNDFEAFRETYGHRDGVYDAYVTRAVSTAWVDEFFTRYAGLARLIGTAITQWCANMLCLGRRFTADKDLITRHLGLHGPAVIDSFERFASDPHGGGQSVAIIRLVGGRRLVYKPTDQSLAALWASATELCFGAGWSSAPLVREGYGWHHFIDTVSDADSDVTSRSLGHLLALSTALGSTDVHFENFLATKLGVVLVDHETVLSPRIDVRSAVWNRSQQAAYSAVLESVLATGGLPRWNPGPDGALWSADAFGWVVAGGDNGSTFPFIANPNSDHMQVSRDPALRDLAQSGGTGPAIDRASVNSDALLEGFRDAWRRVTARKAELGDLVNQAGEARVRVVLRSTREYAEYLAQASMPPYCHDFLDRSLLFERLRQVLDGIPPSDRRWSVVDAEVDALLRGDVPLFWTEASELRLREAASDLEAVPLRGSSPVVHARHCLNRLGPTRRLPNDELITSAIEASEWPGVTVRRATVRAVSRHRDGWRGRLATASALFAIVRGRAFVSPLDRSIAVVGATLDASGRAQHLGVVDSADVYAGIGGLGVLAAALNVVQPRPRYADTARRVADALSVTLEALSNGGKAERAGAFSGISGVGYMLHVIADLLNERTYSDLARWCIVDWERASGGAGADLDVISGAAGAGLVGLSLGAPEHEDLGQFVRIRAERLVATAIADDVTCAWPQIGATQESGFAHGSAGIAAALARVSKAGLMDRPESAAGLISKAAESEIARFDTDVSGWSHIDSTLGGPPSSAAGWCYGGAGMLLAGVALSGVSGASGALVDCGVRAILNEATDADGLCHGTGGSSAILWAYADVACNKELAAAASRRLDDIADRFQTGRAVGVEPTTSLAHSLGLMTGSSGIGLALISREVDHLAARILSVS